ncbi:MAG: ATP-binding protein [Bauldia sp.]
MSATDTAPAPRRGSLYRKYVLLFVGVVAAALLAAGALELPFAYRDRLGDIERFNRQQATATTGLINQFLEGMEGQLRWTAQFTATNGDYGGNLAEAQRLLREVPDIAELAQVDRNGLEQVWVSRMSLNALGRSIDLSRELSFRSALLGETFFGDVTFDRDGRPVMTVAVAATGGAGGVSIAEVNLGAIVDLLGQIDVGEGGVAFVVDGRGQLVAHSDMRNVPANRDLSALPQVAVALGGRDAIDVARNLAGERMISATAPIASPGWHLFVEVPYAVAVAPIYASLLRTAALLLLGLGIAMLAGLYLARRMVGPVRVLQAGADRIGSGEFGHRIAVRTGDEIETLADKFNEMASYLEASRAELESKVRQRTAELAEKSRQLELASQHKSQFLANMSHELRTPLSAVLGYTELMLDNIYGAISDRSREVLTRIEANGRHLLQLINDVLDLSRIEAGQIELTIGRYDLPDLVRGVVAGMESIARAKGLELRTEIPPDIPTATGDERRVTQILLNLVGNALKFTERGHVAIAVRAAGDFFEVDVADTGPGIAAHEHERIFGEFQQVDASTTRRTSGTGLGLAISRRLVERHGGTIAVESEPGQGSLFRVRLPVTLTEVKVAA